MSHEQVEREDKYDVDADFILPDLSALVPDGRITFDTYDLKATYYDTEGRHLQRRKITLRRRTGGHDGGWHLKLPAGDARTEVQVTSKASSPPRELAAMLKGVRRGKKLVRAATVETTRSAVTLHDAADAVLAEVVLDGVHAVRLGGDDAVTDWREAEVELGAGGDTSLLTRIGEVLVEAGARPSGYASKFGRAVGASHTHHRPRRLAGLVDDYLQVQYDAITDGDLALRRDDNVVHVTRVAIRRLRSTVRIFSALFDAEESQRLEAELVWFAGLLGAVRDLDVLRDRLEAQVRALRAEVVLGPVEARIASTLSSERGEAWRELRKAMDAKRYLSLLELLDRWQEDPPFTSRADKKQTKVASYVAKAGDKAKKRLRGAAASDASDDELHGARKAEKRYRYASELALPVLGKHAAKEVDRAKGLQDLIGEHQDATLSVALLRRMGLDAAAAGENAFTFGVLWGQESERAAATRAELVDRFS